MWVDRLTTVVVDLFPAFAQLAYRFLFDLPDALKATVVSELFRALKNDRILVRSTVELPKNRLLETTPFGPKLHACASLSRVVLVV